MEKINFKNNELWIEIQKYKIKYKKKKEKKVLRYL